jgi:gliding motility-associated-like protein
VTGCYTIVELVLIVNPLPDVATTIEDYIICEANTDGRALFDLTTKIPEILNGQDPAEFTVSFHEVEADAQTGQNAIPQADLTVYRNRTNPQQIFVRIENNTSECSVSTASFFLEVLEGAEAVAPLAALEDCEDELGSGIATFDLTQLDAGILNGQDPTVFVLTYHEDLADAETGSNAIANPSSYQSPSQTIYARVFNTDTDCYGIAEIELLVNPIPDIGLEETYRMCVDASGNPIPQESGAASPPILDTGLSTPQYSFIWELDGTVLAGETRGALTALQEGVYTVTVTNMATGCQNTASATVTISSPPLTYSAQVVTAAFAGSHAIQASAEGPGSYLFSLDGGPFQSSGLFENVSPGRHTVTITDANGCGSVQVQVGVIDYPLFFTPNGDGYHDTWNIIGIAGIPSAKIYIFDRYGKLLKQLSPTGPGWDGTFNGRPLPSSDYWFQVIYTEDGVQKEFKGHFTLKR